MKIQCKGVDFSYEKQPLQPLISNLNLEIGSGENVWIQGRSGTGKSSFLRLVAGLQRPQKGIISVDSKSFAELSETSLRKFRLENIGYLHQENHLIDHWTVLQNLELTSQKKDMDGTLPELLSGLGLKKDILRHAASTLSGGERQRISLARVLLQTPKILLLDEPTSHLDDESAKAAMSLVQRYLPNSTTLVISHDLRLKNYNFRQFHFGEIQK